MQILPPTPDFPDSPVPVTPPAREIPRQPETPPAAPPPEVPAPDQPEPRQPPAHDPVPPKPQA
jgi:hypothetical protein